MTLLLVLYAVAVGVLFTTAAALADAGLRGAVKPARLVWIAAIALTATAPLWGPRVSARAPAEPVTVAPLEVGVLVEAAPAAAPSLWTRLEAVRLRAEGVWASAQPALAAPRPVLGWLWFALGSLGVIVVAGGLLRLERRAARLPRTVVDGEEVSVSKDFGPALVGVRKPRTVVPHWVLSLARREVELILAHERTHRAAGDGFVLAMGLIAVAICPWNPLVWMQFRRLRDAVEMDCDRRLLKGGVSLPAYARVLVLVRLRAAEVGGGAVALVDSGSSLERRLKTMRGFAWTRKRVALTAVAALGVGVMACETPAPGVVEVEMEAPAEAEVAVIHEEEAPAGVVTVRGELRADGEREEPIVIFTESAEGAPADGKPLIVVDGVIIHGGDISDLSPSNIERIEVIKGGAAQELFGERGANGVIQVTTKDGEAEIVVEGVEMVPAGEFRFGPLPKDESAGGGVASFIVEGVHFEPDAGVADARVEGGPVAATVVAKYREVSTLRRRDGGN